MSEIIVWFPGDPKQSNWFHSITGHAALSTTNTYCSFWPDLKSFKSDQAKTGLIESLPADFTKDSLVKDISSMEYDPDARLSLAGLDEGAIEQKWSEICETKVHYHVKTTNCCTVTSHLLNIGFVNTEIGRKVKKRQGQFAYRTTNLNTFLDMSQEPTLTRKWWQIVTITPSAFLYFALLIENALAGFPKTEKQVHQYTKQLRAESGLINL